MIKRLLLNFEVFTELFNLSPALHYLSPGFRAAFCKTTVSFSHRTCMKRNL